VIRDYVSGQIQTHPAQQPLEFSKLCYYIKRYREAILDSSKFSKRESYEALKLLDAKWAGDVRLYIDTIHAAKGDEADIVIVGDGITKTIQEGIWGPNFERAFDDEMRVWYVAATRARQTLIVATLSNRRYRPFLTGVVM